MKISRFLKIAVSVFVFVAFLSLVSCGNAGIEPEDDLVDQNISERVDNADDYVSPINLSELPELDEFQLPKVTGTTAELALGYIPSSLNDDISKFGFNLISFTNIKHGLERLGYYSSSPSDFDLILASMYSPDFLLSRIYQQKQPIDDPENWNWMVHDTISGGTWFAGNLSMGDKLLPAMSEDGYSTEPLINSSMTSFLAPWSNKSPIYGRQVAPYSPEFGYFNYEKNNVEQADETAVLIRQKEVGLASEKEIADMIPFIGDAENAVLIKSKLTLENSTSNLGIGSVMSEDRLKILENLKGCGRHIGLDWIAFSHHPDEELPIRIILRYKSNQVAETDMKVLKYIHENNLSRINKGEEIQADLIKIDMKRFSVYQNVGLIECQIVKTELNNNPNDPLGASNIRAADKLSELFLKGLMPELFLNK